MTAPARGAPGRTPAVIALAVLAVIVMLMVMFPRGNGTPATPAVRSGTDPAQTARNLATWLRQQADWVGGVTTGGPR